MNELMDKLGISDIPYKQDQNIYTFDLGSDDLFSKVFSKISNDSSFDEDETKAALSMDQALFSYMNDDYYITISADFDEDKYTLEIEDLNG